MKRVLLLLLAMGLAACQDDIVDQASVDTRGTTEEVSGDLGNTDTNNTDVADNTVSEGTQNNTWGTPWNEMVWSK